MKELTKLFSMLLIVLALGFTSCGSDDSGDDNKPQEVILQVSGLDAPFSSEASSMSMAQELVITCNSSWGISSKPDWIDMTPQTGSGNATVKVWPNQENSGSELSGEIVITAGDKRVTKIVTQRSMYGTAKTTPTNVLVMCYGVAMDFSCTNDVAYYDYQIMLSSELTKYSDKELVSYMKTSSITERKTPADQWIVSTTSLSTTQTTGVNYTIVTVSYDSNGKLGQIVKYPFTTKPLNNQAYIYATNLGIVYDSNYNYYLQWDMEANSYVNKYYTWTVLATKQFLTYEKGDYLVAWFVSREIAANPSSHYTNINSNRGYSVSYERLEGPQLKAGTDVGLAPFDSDKFIQILSWATDQNNELAGVIDNGLWSVDSSSSGTSNSPKFVKIPSQEIVNGGKITNVGISKKELYENLSIR
ncbi:MAG: BACON domain-containing protein [Prevotella sp.]|nr:BACON domain-containing protein [Prevotella sp.]